MPRDQMGHERLETLGEDFRNDLVVGVAQGDRSVVRHLPRSGDLGDHPYMCLILTFVQILGGEEVSDVSGNIRTNDIPKGLIETR